MHWPCSQKVDRYFFPEPRSNLLIYLARRRRRGISSQYFYFDTAPRLLHTTISSNKNSNGKPKKEKWKFIGNIGDDFISLYDVGTLFNLLTNMSSFAHEKYPIAHYFLRHVRPIQSESRNVVIWCLFIFFLVTSCKSLCLN